MLTSSPRLSGSDGLRRMLDAAIIEFLVNSSYIAERAALVSVWFPEASPATVLASEGPQVEETPLWVAVAMVGAAAVVNAIQALPYPHRLAAALALHADWHPPVWPQRCAAHAPVFCLLLLRAIDTVVTLCKSSCLAGR